MKKFLNVFLAILFTVSLLSGCAADLQYYDGLDSDKGYNNNLFYRNDLNTVAADPTVIYVTEGDEAGYFYMYATSTTLSGTGFLAWRSADLNLWEEMGPAYIPDRDSWGLTSLWAPEVIYYKTAQEKQNNLPGKYYLWYSAQNRLANNSMAIGVAVSEKPGGPFVQYTGGTITKGTPIIPRSALGFPAIDVSPFVDDNGDIYLYFARNQVSGASDIFGLKMNNMFSPNYSTLKQLTAVGKSTVNSIANDQQWELATIATTNKWNEGPFMYKENGKYFLTYSANPYFTRYYAVGAATSSSPLGDFTKFPEGQGNPVLSIDADMEHMSGTGHHSFVKAGEELFIVYHAHLDRVFGNGVRGIAFDRVFIENGIMRANGPTYSLQPLPEVASGYKNVAPSASVTATNSDLSDPALLTDGFIVFHHYDTDKEFEADGGSTVITLSFDTAVTARAVMIYNSFYYEDFLQKIDSIEFETESGKKIIKNLKIDPEYINEPEEIVRPGSAFIAEFDELKLKKVTITIKADVIKLSEIVVLGK